MIEVRRWYWDLENSLDIQKENSNKKGKTTESSNLILQAHKYLKNHLSREITKCNDFQTPNIDAAFEDEFRVKVKSLPKNLTEGEHQ